MVEEIAALTAHAIRLSSEQALEAAVGRKQPLLVVVLDLASDPSSGGTSRRHSARDRLLVTRRNHRDSFHARGTNYRGIHARSGNCGK